MKERARRIHSVKDYSTIRQEALTLFLFNGKKAGTAPAFRDPEADQNEISLFLETRMKISMEVIVSTFRMVASAAAGPSEPRVTCA